jgi:hypothetical protein
MSDKVRIVHPNHPGHVGEVTRSAYERRSRKLGWVLVEDEPFDEETAAVNEVTTALTAFRDDLKAEAGFVAPPSEDDLNNQLDERDQLRQLLTDRGVTGWDGRTGVKKLRQLAEESE